MTTSIPKHEVMPFGKHKGTALKDLKVSYVVWVLELKTLNENLRKSLESLPGIPEFKRRQADAIMFSKPCFQRDNHYSKNQRIAYNNAKYNQGV